MNDNKNVEVKVNNNKNIMIEYRELIEKYDILCVGDDINNSVHMLGNKNIYFVDESFYLNKMVNYFIKCPREF